ncbi:MAG: diacylglycerol kinase family lipid kinase [Chloroflexi bacterium]|nr:MAG: diacylglycerol kinase family lipid kinase [Chloroflexota bacterium]
MRVVLIVNPTSGASMLTTHQGTLEEHEEQMLTALRTRGLMPEIWHTTPGDAGTGLAQKAVAEGVEMVIAAGGDGTLHAVANGLIHSNSALGIIPIGTMNNIARSLSIPEDIEEACAIIAHGKTTRIDVGKINGNIFLEVAGIGLEAALFPAAEEIKRHGVLSTMRGVLKGLAVLLTFQPTRFKIAFDNQHSLRYRAIQVSVCNSPYYGVHLQFAPNAVMDDGLLNVLLYRNFSKRDYLQHAISISQGVRSLEPRVMRRKIKMLYIEADPPVVVHADGEPIGQTPATIVVLPAVLHVRVPIEVAIGPNIMDSKRKRTHILQQASMQ